MCADNPAAEAFYRAYEFDAPSVQLVYLTQLLFRFDDCSTTASGNTEWQLRGDGTPNRLTE